MDIAWTNCGSLAVRSKCRNALRFCSLVMVQSFNTAGIRAAFQLLAHPRLLMPHLAVADIRAIPFTKLRQSGIEYMVFDKDNCLTAPYLDVVHTEFLPAWENCLDVFSRSNVMIVSNSAGTPDDTDDAAACAVEAALGVRVLRHAVKKPGCGPEVIEAFGNVCPGKIAVVGDRLMTDVALANFNGMMGIWTRDIITTKGDNAAAAAIRKAEHWAYRALVRRGVHAPAIGASGNTGQ